LCELSSLKMFYHVRQFIFGLDDLDFLSIIDGSSFVNKRVTVRRIYWNRIFGIISDFVEVESNRDKQTLAAALRKVVIERLASVSKKIFVRFFTTRIIRNQKSLFDKLNKLRKTLSLADEQRYVQEEKVKFDKLFEWIESLKFLRNTIATYRRKNNCKIDSFPDVRFVKKIESTDPKKVTVACFVPDHNAILIVGSRSLSQIKSSFLHELQHWLFESSGNAEWHHTSLFWSELKKLHNKAKIPKEFHITELLPDPITFDSEDAEPEDTENNEQPEPPLDYNPDTAPGPEPNHDDLMATFGDHFGNINPDTGREFGDESDTPE